MTEKKYTVVKESMSRKLIRDSMYIAMRKPFIKGSLDIDVTELRQQLRQVRRAKDGFNLTLSAYLLYAYAKTLEAYPEANTLLNYKASHYIFDEVDVFTPVLVEDAGKASVKYSVIRKANKLSLKALVAKLEESKKKPFELPYLSQRIFIHLPSFVRKWVYRMWEAFPLQFKHQLGTGTFSYVQLPSKFAIGLPVHTTGVYITGMQKQVVGGQTRYIIPGVCCLDHRIGDGMLLAQLGGYYKDFIESGKGLEAYIKI